jgi:predicted Ser/Thr protein kinase
MGAQSVEEMAKRLKDMGYSRETVERILKWYK